MKDAIFVGIASYRDPELVPTLRDALARRSGRYRLVLAICHQHGDEDAVLPFSGPEFRVVAVPHAESRGVCWARSRLRALYDGERYMLQLDSHHRFDQDWDATLVDMLRGLDCEKPLLTTYLPAYDPDVDHLLGPAVYGLKFDRFNDQGTLLMATEAIPSEQQTGGPVPARFFSAHFCFTLGRFCEEVPYDPELYFHGEEISLAVRAYTHGYDLYHPHRSVAWHEYTRKGRRKHWDDHTGGDRGPSWSALDQASQRRVRVLLGMEDAPEAVPAPYGLGSRRSLGDYERFAGVDFKRRRVEQYTLDNQPPPNPAAG